MKYIRRISALCLMTLCVICVAAQASMPGVIQFSETDSDISGSSFVEETREQTSASAQVEIPTATLSPEAAALPWNLTLVNFTHPVPEGWSFEVKDLSTGRKVDARIYADLQAMFDACRAEGLTPRVNTAYRTYEDQQDMLVTKYRQYKKQGLSHEQAQAKALTVASYPGYSEHQLGLAVDINSANQEKCSNDRVWKWMKENCQDYGFIWRYPGVKSEITGISNEDWHFRYVGREAARYIMENQLCLEEYLQQQYGIQ